MEGRHPDLTDYSLVYSSIA